MNRGGLCESCIDPGHCCRDLNLSTREGRFTVWDGEDPVAALEESIGQHPFEPLRTDGEWHDGESGRTYRAYRWRCTALTPEGRCSIYENRPKLCRQYQEGSDPLCVHHHERVWPRDGLAKTPELGSS